LDFLGIWCLEFEISEYPNTRDSVSKDYLRLQCLDSDHTILGKRVCLHSTLQAKGRAMVQEAQPSVRNRALQPENMADLLSSRKINDSIARRAIAGMPEFILVQTDPQRGGAGLVKTCRLTALPPLDLNNRLIPALLLTAGRRRAKDGSLGLVEIPFDTAGGPIRPAPLGCWDDVAGLVSEAVIGEIDQAFRSKPVIYRFGDCGLLRAFWRLISGEGRSEPNRHDRKSILHPVLFAERRAASSRRADFPGWLDEKLFEKHPVLMVGARRKHLLAIRLRRPIEPMAVGLKQRRLGPKDVLGIDPFINPFYRAAAQASDRLARLLAEPPRPVEAGEDAAFMDLLRGRYILNGRGAYRNFSIQNWGEREGKRCISVCLSMGRKSFLQQTLPEPVFIHWDLRRYPVTVFSYLMVGSDTETDVVFSDILVWCNHPSICRHAFVRGLQEGGPPHYGTVCTESTRHRLLRLHSRDKAFDPAAYLVEKLRSAARVLRYGLRRRDMGITQHNQFAKVPETEFQAVIRGYAEARRFAEQTRSEFVTFDR